MPAHDRSRFLISVAKLLGKNPTQDHPLADVVVCEDWLIDEIVNEVVPGEGQFKLDFERFNRLMLNCGRRLATPHFYNYFFAEVGSLDAFEHAVQRYRVKAMWLFGNFEFGYRRIATSPQAAFDSLMHETEPTVPDIYEFRSNFEDIEQIPVDDLELLGYISSGELKDLDVSQAFIATLLDNPSTIAEIIGKFGSQKQAKVSEVLAKHGIAFPVTGAEQLSEAALQEVAKKIASIFDPLKARQDEAVATGKRNTHRYLTLPHLDVYVATSMRTHEDYLAQHAFIRSVFSDPNVAGLKLRYFDPTLSYVDDRISKGLVEMLMLQRAAVTIYNAGAEDTLGKDSELAATLAQGKAVIVFVPSDPNVITLSDGRKVNLDRRAEMFRVGHPLGLQIDVRTGVAHGIIVVRTAKQCAQMLRKMLLHELSFAIRHEHGNFLLEETDTHSVLRVVSDDPFLTHAFWTYFRHSAPEEN